MIRSQLAAGVRTRSPQVSPGRCGGHSHPGSAAAARPGSGQGSDGASVPKAASLSATQLLNSALLSASQTASGSTRCPTSGTLTPVISGGGSIRGPATGTLSPGVPGMSAGGSIRGPASGALTPGVPGMSTGSSILGPATGTLSPGVPSMSAGGSIRGPATGALTPGLPGGAVSPGMPLGAVSSTVPLFVVSASGHTSQVARASPDIPGRMHRIAAAGSYDAAGQSAQAHETSHKRSASADKSSGAASLQSMWSTLRQKETASGCLQAPQSMSSGSLGAPLGNVRQHAGVDASSMLAPSRSLTDTLSCSIRCLIAADSTGSCPSLPCPSPPWTLAPPGRAAVSPTLRRPRAPEVVSSAHLWNHGQVPTAASNTPVVSSYQLQYLPDASAVPAPAPPSLVDGPSRIAGAQDQPRSRLGPSANVWHMKSDSSPIQPSLASQQLEAPLAARAGSPLGNGTDPDSPCFGHAWTDDANPSSEPAPPAAPAPTADSGLKFTVPPLRLPLRPVAVSPQKQASAPSVCSESAATTAEPQSELSSEDKCSFRWQWMSVQLLNRLACKTELLEQSTVQTQSLLQETQEPPPAMERRPRQSMPAAPVPTTPTKVIGPGAPTVSRSSGSLRAARPFSRSPTRSSYRSVQVQSQPMQQQSRPATASQIVSRIGGSPSRRTTVSPMPVPTRGRIRETPCNIPRDTIGGRLSPTVRAVSPQWPVRGPRIVRSGASASVSAGGKNVEFESGSGAASLLEKQPLITPAAADDRPLTTDAASGLRDVANQIQSLVKKQSPSKQGNNWSRDLLSGVAAALASAAGATSNASPSSEGGCLKPAVTVASRACENSQASRAAKSPVRRPSIKSNSPPRGRPGHRPSQHPGVR